MQQKYLVLSPGPTLQLVTTPKPDDVTILCPNDFLKNIPKHLQFDEFVQVSSLLVMQGVKNFSKIGLPSKVLNEMTIGTTEQEVKSFLHAQIDDYFKGKVYISLKKADIHYIYDLIFFDQDYLKKIYRFKADRIFRIEQILKAGGVTEDIMSKVRPVIIQVKNDFQETSPPYLHSQIVQAIQKTSF